MKKLAIALLLAAPAAIAQGPKYAPNATWVDMQRMLSNPCQSLDTLMEQAELIEKRVTAAQNKRSDADWATHLGVTSTEVADIKRAAGALTSMRTEWLQTDRGGDTNQQRCQAFQVY